MKKLNLLLLIGIVVSVFASCTKEESEGELMEVTLKSAQVEVPDLVCNEEFVVFDLIAGQHMNAGIVSIVNDEEYLYVTFETSGDVMIKEVHVYVGDAAGVPVTKGKNATPIPGQFPYKAEKLYTNSYTIAIPLIDITEECPIILAHAALSNGETAWGWENEMEEFTFESFFGTKRWGYLGDYCIVECEDETILVVKSRLVDTIENSAWTTSLYTGESPYESGWCEYMSLIEPEDGGEYNIVSHYNQISGTVQTSISEGNLTIMVTASDENTIVKESYFYYGSLSEFMETYMVEGEDCPDILAFPHEYNTAEDKTSQTILINMD